MGGDPYLFLISIVAIYNEYLLDRAEEVLSNSLSRGLLIEASPYRSAKKELRDNDIQYSLDFSGDLFQISFATNYVLTIYQDIIDQRDSIHASRPGREGVSEIRKYSGRLSVTECTTSRMVEQSDFSDTCILGMVCFFGWRCRGLIRWYTRGFTTVFAWVLGNSGHSRVTSSKRHWYGVLRACAVGLGVTAIFTLYYVGRALLIWIGKIAKGLARLGGEDDACTGSDETQFEKLGFRTSTTAGELLHEGHSGHQHVAAFRHCRLGNVLNDRRSYADHVCGRFHL